MFSELNTTDYQFSKMEKEFLEKRKKLSKIISLEKKIARAETKIKMLREELHEAKTDFTK